MRKSYRLEIKLQKGVNIQNMVQKELMREDLTLRRLIALLITIISIVQKRLISLQERSLGGIKIKEEIQ